MNRLRRALHVVLGAAALAAGAVSLAIARPLAPAGPTGTVTGRIVRSDGPKYEVTVIDQSTWKTVNTEPDGSFRFEGVSAGDHLFRIRSDYCDVQLIPVSVRAGRVSTFDVELACKPRPCPKPDRADPTCIVENPEQRQRVGTFCEVHRGTKLKLGLVPIHYGIDDNTPGLSGEGRKAYPNARPSWSAGCVDTGQRWAEVAYCTRCRASYELRSLTSRLLHRPR